MNTLVTTNVGHCQTLLKNGEVVAIPTETVYGLAAHVFNDAAVGRIFELKQRPKFNPLIVHLHQMAQLDSVVRHIPKKAQKLMEHFWPGALTLILPKHPDVSDLITAGKPTVAVRMPKHPMTRALLQGLDFPLAAPSANPFTRVSPTSAKHVLHYFNGKIAAILDGGPCEVGLESTIVGFEGETPVVFRKGGIAIEALERLVGPVRLFTDNESAPQAPGMLLKHYSPRTPLIISSNIRKRLEACTDKRVGVLSFYADDFPTAETIKVLSPKKDMEEAAKGLFAALHALDALDLDLIIAEAFPEEGLGRSIQDRLRRAAH
ncbi:L-threonylcarbamoyladenylate synthase [Maribacter sp. 2307ULW6-5]|uniref:L-threonylcarbamoyladenylate synthase n=1 Tax=Maribacter sp. 2307ULW6-5 TaxID=3386275 RepID=UPI0039BCEFC8